MAVSATFAMVGGGDQNDPPSNSKTRKARKTGDTAIDSSEWARSKSFRSFFGSGEYWGQQRSSKVTFSKHDGFVRNAGHYLGNYNSYAKSKKAKDSSWNALSPRWWQISPKINRLSVRGHVRSQERHFWAKQFFNDYFCVWNDRAIILTPSCLPRQDASKHV